jgi:hypothetical protein
MARCNRRRSPAYSTNFTKKQILYAKYYDSPAKFHLAVNGFFDNINDT